MLIKKRGSFYSCFDFRLQQILVHRNFIPKTKVATKVVMTASKNSMTSTEW